MPHYYVMKGTGKLGREEALRKDHDHTIGGPLRDANLESIIEMAMVACCYILCFISSATNLLLTI